MQLKRPASATWPIRFFNVPISRTIQGRLDIPRKTLHGLATIEPARLFRIQLSLRHNDRARSLCFAPALKGAFMPGLCTVSDVL
jgi:hypothetical protein